MRGRYAARAARGWQARGREGRLVGEEEHFVPHPSGRELALRPLTFEGRLIQEGRDEVGKTVKDSKEGKLCLELWVIVTWCKVRNVDF